MHEPTAQIRNEGPDITQVPAKLQIYGPDDASFLVEAYQNGYVWRIRNGSLHAIPELRLEVASVQSFDAAKRAFRDQIDLTMPWPPVRNAPPGELTKHAILVRLEDGHLELGNTKRLHRLSWPSGDLSGLQRWRLRLSVHGLSRGWWVELDLRWEVGSKTLELTEYSGTSMMRSGSSAPESPKSDFPPIEPENNPVKPPLAPVFTNAAEISKARAETVAKLIRELDALRPVMLEDENEHARLRRSYPDFLCFKIATTHHDLKAKILAIRGSARHIRLAQELAAAHHSRRFSTIREDWKSHKPDEFRHLTSNQRSAMSKRAKASREAKRNSAGARSMSKLPGKPH